MELDSIVPFLINGGVALVVVFLVIARRLVPGWSYEERIEELGELKVALEHERRTADEAMKAAQATKDVLLSLRGHYVDDRDVRA